MEPRADTCGLGPETRKKDTPRKILDYMTKFMKEIIYSLGIEQISRSLLKLESFVFFFFGF